VACQHDEFCLYPAAERLHGGDCDQRGSGCDWVERAGGGYDWDSFAGGRISPGFDSYSDDDSGYGGVGDQPLCGVEDTDAAGAAVFAVEGAVGEPKAEAIRDVSDCACYGYISPGGGGVDCPFNGAPGSLG